MSEVWCVPCARICARTSCILLTIRDRDDFIRNTCFPFVKGVCFEMQSDALKAMISQPKVWRVFQSCHPVAKSSICRVPPVPLWRGAASRVARRVRKARRGSKANAPRLPLTGRLRASHRRSATQRDLLVGTGLIWSTKFSRGLENAQQDAQLPRAVFPRVPAPVVEHTRYNSSRKRRRFRQPAADFLQEGPALSEA
jgi:hypothetical protein